MSYQQIDLIFQELFGISFLDALLDGSAIIYFLSHRDLRRGQGKPYPSGTFGYGINIDTDADPQVWTNLIIYDGSEFFTRDKRGFYAPFDLEEQKIKFRSSRLLKNEIDHDFKKLITLLYQRNAIIPRFGTVATILTSCLEIPDKPGVVQGFMVCFTRIGMMVKGETVSFETVYQMILDATTDQETVWIQDAIHALNEEIDPADVPLPLAELLIALQTITAKKDSKSSLRNDQ